MNKRNQENRLKIDTNRKKPVPNVSGRNSSISVQSTEEVNQLISAAKDEQSQKNTSNDAQKKTSHSLLVQFTSAAAVASIIASLIGYGVVMGISHTFGHSHETLINSGLDLITMVWPSVLMIATSLDKIWSFDLFAEVWKQAKFTMLAVGIIVFFAILISIWLRQRFPNQIWKDRIKAHLNKRKNFFSSIFIAVIGSIMSMTVIFFLQVIGIFSIITLFVFLCLPPTMGYLSGVAYAQKYIIEPQHCATPPNRTKKITINSTKRTDSDKEKNLGAECILISSLDPSKPFFRVGRTVLSSSNAILLWNPDSGIAHRTPLAGMDVNSIDENEFQQISKLLELYPFSCLSLTGDGRRLAVKPVNGTKNQCK
ncbi:hypothetical protein [Comamonas thiooxydans]|uniref:hypothetical protein n=1 Tax=Comamonas thiooxydans TaxID=363952 RepID=UPI0001BB191F|nr:hypothetical protein [Comamonas thiooxydans]ACY34476.1 hypothetical protein CtCNB1_3730 [Comamonas thiooxydans]MDO1476859.1 hypothetical protein [Comamonas thiooxydans]